MCTSYAVHNSVNHLYRQEVVDQQLVLYVNNNDNVNIYNVNIYNVNNNQLIQVVITEQ